MFLLKIWCPIPIFKFATKKTDCVPEVHSEVLWGWIGLLKAPSVPLNKKVTHTFTSFTGGPNWPFRLSFEENLVSKRGNILTKIWFLLKHSLHIIYLSLKHSRQNFVLKKLYAIRLRLKISSKDILHWKTVENIFLLCARQEFRLFRGKLACSVTTLVKILALVIVL